MLNTLARFIACHGLVQPGDHVVCALSGGADSVAMTFGLYLLRDKLGITLSAAHFNHRLRGEESDADEAFVREFCHRYDIPLHCGGAEVRPGKKGLEAAAREARYAFFATLPGKLATAHTADDNAETLLLHLIRGTGLKGLGGIAPAGERLIRPMLSVTRAQVEEFCSQWCLDYVTDSSNATDAFLRNRLRHRVMPLLRQENPRLAEKLSALALRLRLDEQVLQAQTPDTAEVAQLRALPQGLRSRALERLLKSFGVPEPEAEHIALAQALVFSDNPSARGEFPGGVTVGRSYGTLVRLDAAAAPEDALLNCPGVTELPQWGLRVTCREADRLENTDRVFTVSARGPISVTTRRSGDAITLPGGTGSLKKLFIDRKIPAADRCRVPVLRDEAGVLAVGGLGVNRQRMAGALPALTITLEALQK